MKTTLLRLALAALPLCASFRSSAQKNASIHSIGELMEILEKSKLSYELNTGLDEPVDCAEHKSLNEAFAYSKKSGEGTVKAGYQVSPAGRRAMEKAEEQFGAGHYDSARRSYQLFTELQPEVSTGWVYLAQTYEIDKDWKTAIRYLRKAVDLNYYDYLAHYFLADDYLRTAEPEKALEEIALASVLNRNNPNIVEAMRRIFSANGLELREWCFAPQIALSTTEEGHIDVKCGANWLGYAVAKAIWQYEPGYREKYGAGEGRYNLNEDKECLAALAVALDLDSAKGYRSEPALAALAKATKNKFFQEYLVYELALPEYPAIVYQLEKSQLDDLRRYVIAVRGREKRGK